MNKRTEPFSVEFHADNSLRRVSRAGVSRAIELPPGWPLFRLLCRHGGEDILVRTGDFPPPDRTERNGRVTELRWAGCSTAPGLALSLRITPLSDELRLNFAIELADSSELQVLEADLPVLPVPYTRGRDRLLIPSDRGEFLPDAPKDLTSGGYTGHARFVYPGRAAMQYSEVYNDAEGLYFSAYHTGDETFELGYEAPGGTRDPKHRYDPDDVAEGTINLFHRYYPYLTNGKWFSPVLSVALHPGDWHTGADLYRRVLSRLIQTDPERPAWMREDFHGWVKTSMEYRGRILRRFADLPGLVERMTDATGLDVLHVAWWNEDGCDARCPDCRLNTELGSEQEVREALSAIRRTGARTVLYANGRVVDPNSIFFKEGGDREIVENADGTRPTERYSTPIDFQIACPSSVYYRKFLAGEIAYAMSLGAQGVQIDQVSMGPAEFCWATHHEHTKPSNNWIRGLEALCRECKLAYRAADPDAFAWIEGVHELFGQFYEVSQCHGEAGGFIRILPDGKKAPGYPEMFRYTFPAFLITGIAGSPAYAIRTMLQGKPFDVNDDILEKARLADRIKEFVSLRKALPEFYLRGTFKDTVGFQLRYGREQAVLREGMEGEPLMARAIESACGNRLLVGVWNRTDQPIPCHIRFDPKYAGDVRLVYPPRPGEGLGRSTDPADPDVPPGVTILVKG